MMNEIRVELLVLRKRTATWVLLGVWTLLAMIFAYIVPYMLSRTSTTMADTAALRQLMPDRIPSNLIDGFPFYGGAFAIMLGVLAIGSDYGWGTLKTLFTQGPSRLRVFGAKVIAIAITLVPFVILPFVLGGMSSVIIALLENSPIIGPSAISLVEAVLASLLIMLAWAAFGIVLAVLSRGTSLAIGVGILYTLALEGLLSLMAGSVSLLEPLVKLFVRTNAYSLIKPLGAASADGASSGGPGAFDGPFVSTTQALIMLAVYVVVFVGVSAVALRRRDVA
ncbi:MAG: ABC transporter permease subunit [Thermomicrobiales bacterium]|nr:ABC transporter permease subunit [Thermomicrobiales bacterium]